MLIKRPKEPPIQHLSPVELESQLICNLNRQIMSYRNSPATPTCRTQMCLWQWNFTRSISKMELRNRLKTCWVTRGSSGKQLETSIRRKWKLTKTNWKVPVSSATSKQRSLRLRQTIILLTRPITSCQGIYLSSKLSRSPCSKNSGCRRTTISIRFFVMKKYKA